MSNTQFVMHKRENLCLLVDNGSIRDHAVLFTRKLAKNLSEISGREVVAVSLDHSYRIPVEKLNGMEVPILETLLSELENDNQLRSLTVLPFLMVSGGAIYRKIEAQVEKFRIRRSDVGVKMTEALIDMTAEGRPDTIQALLTRSLLNTIDQEQLTHPDVIIVDHGSPYPEAAEARNWVARQVEKAVVPNDVKRVIAASMERRPGPEYDFNDPLVENALRTVAENGSQTVVIAKLFLQPGKHSGRRGDIDSIVESVREAYPKLRIVVQKQSFSLKSLTNLLLHRLGGSN